jgi:electron-transferring-flavoprotein dehydrogenase
LAAAIRLKQLAIEAEVDLDVCVIEKGEELGAHILSGKLLDKKCHRTHKYITFLGLG